MQNPWHTHNLSRKVLQYIGAPIFLGRCPSLSAHESESMLRTYLVCREKQERERERETSNLHVGEAHSILTAAILLPQRLSCYWGKTVSLRMLTSLRLANLRVTTAQQRTTGQNLLSDLYQPLLWPSVKTRGPSVTPLCYRKTGRERLDSVHPHLHFSILEASASFSIGNVQWRAATYIAMHFWVPNRHGNVLVSWATVSFWRRRDLSSMKSRKECFIDIK
jgi:hypothetical protein